MEQKAPIANFKDGIKSVPAFFGGRVRDILNQDISDTGFLVPRQVAKPVERLVGTYPRSVQRVFRSVESEATRKTDIYFKNNTLKFGLADNPSLLASLDEHARLYIVKDEHRVLLDILGTTLTIIGVSTQILTYNMVLPGGGRGLFEDGDTVEVIILLDDTEQVDYYEGDQFITAHFLGDDTTEALTRYYRFPEATHSVPIRKGRILLLADGEHRYFIDVRENKRYTWDLTPPLLLSSERDPAISELGRLQTMLLAHYRSGVNANLDIYRNFPHDKLTGIDLDIIGWKFTYENPDFALSTQASKSVFIELETTNQAFLRWLYSGPVYVGNPISTYDHVYLGLLHLGFIDSADVLTIEESQQREFKFNLNAKPDWATHLGIYQTPISRAFYTSQTSDLSNEDENASAWELTTTSIGTGLVATGVIIASSTFIAIGIPFIVLGLIAIGIGDEDDTRTYKVDIDAVEGIGDESYLRYAFKRLPLDEITEYTYELPIDTETDTVYLDAIYNTSPPEQLDAITLHAGRIYGVDRETEDIVFSHIDGNGINNYFAFPLQNRVPTTASGIAPVEKIEQMPDRGGLYIFKRDAIHYLNGQNIFSGLYDINVSAQTDISAAEYKENIGCIAPRSVVNDGSNVLFVGSDAQIYVLSGKTAQPIGVDVTPFIEGLEIEALQNCVATWYKRRFYITLPDSTLILNTERKYWTRFDWVLKDIHWSRGGKTAESILYGITDDGLMQLMLPRTDEQFPIRWESNIEVLRSHSLLTGVYVYTENGHPVKLTVSGNEPVKTQERTFTPKLSNKYRGGCHVKGRNFNIKVESDHAIEIDRIEREYNL